MQFPFLIDLRRSYYFIVPLVLLHLLAAACLAAMDWPWTFRGTLILFVALSAWRVLRTDKITGFCLHKNGQLDSVSVDGVRIESDVLQGTTVFSQMIVLRLRLTGEKRATSLTLLPCHMTSEQFRRLRLWLKWRSTEHASETAITS